MRVCVCARVYLQTFQQFKVIVDVAVNVVIIVVALVIHVIAL